jgi:hypothetical protein
VRPGYRRPQRRLPLAVLRLAHRELLLFVQPLPQIPHLLLVLARLA